MTNYIVTVEKFCPFHQGRSTDARLRFDVSCNKTAEDSNNNLKKIFQNLASFEFLEDEIQSIGVSPTQANQFDVEFTKCSGPRLLEAAKSASVQFIHRRNGKFMDSNENFVPVLLQPLNNTIPQERLSKFSTFHVAKKNESHRQDGILDNSVYTKTIGSLIITETDLSSFSRFTFTFNPLIAEQPNVSVEAQSQTSMQENSSEPKTEPVIVEVNQDINIDDQNLVETVPEDGLTPEIPHDSLKVPSSASVAFEAVFDNSIVIRIELKNLMFQEKRKSCLLENEILLRDNSFENQTETESPSSRRGSLSFRNGTKMSNSQAQARYQDTGGDGNNVKKNIMASSRNSIRISTLRDFVKSMVTQRLQSLGVQQLDCNEILDSWDARQRRTNWYLAWPDEFVDDQRVRRNGIMSPYVSRPNSSLFRLTPSGHISRSIFSTFVHQVDSLKGIINNATCTLIQTSIHMLLPEIKLLCARQLETNNNPMFIQEWIRLILLAAKELKPSTPDDVSVMVNRELRTLKSLSEMLHEATKKIYRKIGKLSVYAEEVFRKTLVRLHPKSLQWVNAFDRALRKCHTPDVIHYDPSKLHNIDLKIGDLLKDHILLSETVTGELLVKNDVDGFWDKFLDLEYGERRIIFLAITEDLQSALRRSLNDIQHLQEIYIEGYPGSIKKLLKDVVDELKYTSKRDDLTLLIKTSIVTHINYLHETLTRLFCVSEEINGITKNFHQTIQNISFNPSQQKHQMKKQNKKFLSRQSNTGTSTVVRIKGYHAEYASGILNSRPLLVVPLSHSDDIFKSPNA